MIGEEVSWTRRGFNVAYTVIVNAIVWIGIPLVISSEVAAVLPGIPLSNPDFIYAFGGAIVGLKVLGALTEGRALSAVFNSGSYIASAYYVWVAGGGGTVSFDVPASGVGLPTTLVFKTGLFLLVLPSLIGAIRPPLAFLLDQSEAGRPAKDLP